MEKEKLKEVTKEEKLEKATKREKTAKTIEKKGPKRVMERFYSNILLWKKETPFISILFELIYNLCIKTIFYIISIAKNNKLFCFISIIFP